MSPLPINSELARRLVFVEKHPNWWKSLYIPAPFISSIIDSYNLNLISDRSGTIILASLATTPSKLNSIYVSIRWSHGNVPSILIQHMCAFEHILINSLLTPSARENTKSRRKRAFIQIINAASFFPAAAVIKLFTNCPLLLPNRTSCKCRVDPYLKISLYVWEGLTNDNERRNVHCNWIYYFYYPLLFETAFMF